MLTFDMLCPVSAWIKVEQLKPYHPHKEEMIKINKGKRFQQAVDAVEEYLKKAKGKDQVSMFTHLSLQVLHCVSNVTTVRISSSCSPLISSRCTSLLRERTIG